MTKNLFSGLLEVTIGNRFIYIAYYGNMSSTITHVSREFEKLFGYGTFAKVHNLGVYETDSNGSAYDDVAYIWAKKIPFRDFYKALEQ